MWCVRSQEEAHPNICRSFSSSFSSVSGWNQRNEKIKAHRRRDKTSLSGSIFTIKACWCRSARVLVLQLYPTDLCFLWSLEELRRSRLFRSRLRLLFSRLRLPRSLLQLRCLSPRPGDPLRLLFLCLSLSLSVKQATIYTIFLPIHTFNLLWITINNAVCRRAETISWLTQQQRNNPQLF